MPDSPSNFRPDQSGQTFKTTQWTAVLEARNGNTPEATTALENLCRTYWPPIYSYLRRSGYTTHDAQDLTQAFFRNFLEQDFLQRLHHREGRFRSFLLTFLKRFLSDERDKARAQKRGGQHHFLSWDANSLDEQSPVSIEGLEPGQAFDRQWAMTLLRRARERLESEYVSSGKHLQYVVLQSYLMGETTDQAYATAASNLSMPENTVKSIIHRMRRRFGHLIRDEVAQTVETVSLINEEIRYLLSVLD